MSPRLFRYLEPTFFSGLLDDPILWLNIRPLGRSLLVDCGQIHHLAKRVLRSVDALFISHAHMDHFMGIDTFIRNVHVAPRTIEIFGPPGLAGKLEKKLAGYDWNLSENSWCSFRVREIFPGRTKTFLLPGPEGFPCRREDDSSRSERVIFENRYITVEADLCDHRIPSLIFRFTERPAFSVDEEKMARAGLVPGDWLRTLKKRFYQGNLVGGPLAVLRSRGEGTRTESVADAARLYQDIQREQQQPAIGYATDFGFTEENLEKLSSLLKGVTLLVCECSFLGRDREKARESYHLCTTDLNQAIERLRPAFLLPMHLSKSYVHHSYRLYEELELPPETTLLRLPDHVPPRPLLPAEAIRLTGLRRQPPGHSLP
jgi:ribonuclease Z